MALSDTRRSKQHRLASFIFNVVLVLGWNGVVPSGNGEPSTSLTNFALSDQTVTLRTGAGYKDNVLLSHLSPQGGGFVRPGLDLDYLGIFAGGSLFFFFVSGDVCFYWNNPSTRHEDLWTAALNF